MDQPVRDSKVDLLSTRNLDFHQRQIKNAAPAVDDFDYVILKQIKDLINGVTSNAQGTNQSVITTVGGGSFIVPGSDSFLIYNRLGNAGADPNLTWAYNGQRLDIVGIKDMMTLHVENGYIGSDGGFNTTSTSEAAVNVPNGTVLGNYITTKNAVEFVGITQPPIDLDGRGDAVLIYDKDANQLMVSYDTAPYVPLGGGGGSAVGVKGTIQLSDGSGHFAGDSHFTYDTTSGVLAIQENHTQFPDSGVIAPIFNATGDADGYIFQAYIPGQPEGFQYPIMMNTAGDIAALGRIISNAFEYDGNTVPPPTSVTRAVVYYDLTSNALLVSYNGAAYIPFGGGSGGTGVSVGIKYAVQLSDGAQKFTADNNFTYDISKGLLSIPTTGINSGVISPIFNASGSGTDNAFQASGTTINKNGEISTGRIYLVTPTNTQVAFMNSNLLSGSAGFTYSTSLGQLVISNAGPTSGVIAQIFNSSATGTTMSFSCGFGLGTIYGIRADGVGVFSSILEINSVFYTWPSTTPAAKLVLTTYDALGTLTWAAASSVITAPGSDTWVIFNDATVFGAVNEFTYNKTNKVLSVGQFTKVAGSGVVACLFNSTATSGSSFTCANGVYGVNYLGGAKFLNLSTIGFASFNAGASAALNPNFPVEIRGSAANLLLSGVAPNLYFSDVSGVNPNSAAVTCAGFIALSTGTGHYGMQKGDIGIVTQSYGTDNSSTIRFLVPYNNAGGYQPVGYINTSGLGMASTVTIYGAVGTNRQLVYSTNTIARWLLYTSSEAESGSNAGSNFLINRYDDTGAFLGTVLSINRASGQVNIPNLVGSLTAPGLNTQVIYNSLGVLAAHANMTFTPGTSPNGGILHIWPDNSQNSGVIATTFNSSAQGATVAFQCASGTCSINGQGDVAMRIGLFSEGVASTYCSIGVNVNAAPANVTYAGMYYDTTNNALTIQALSQLIAWRPIVLSPNAMSNVGIGTYTPAYLLDVNGNCNVNGTCVIRNQVQWYDLSIAGHYYVIYSNQDVFTLVSSGGGTLLKIANVGGLSTFTGGLVSPNYNSTATVNATAQAFQTQSGNFVVFGDGHVITPYIIMNKLRINDLIVNDYSHTWYFDSVNDTLRIYNYASAVIMTIAASGGLVTFNYAVTIAGALTVTGGMSITGVFTASGGFAGPVFNAISAPNNTTAAFQCPGAIIQGNGDSSFGATTVRTLQTTAGGTISCAGVLYANGSMTVTGTLNGNATIDVDQWIRTKTQFMVFSGGVNYTGYTGPLQSAYASNLNVRGGIITTT